MLKNIIFETGLNFVIQLEAKDRTLSTFKYLLIHFWLHFVCKLVYIFETMESWKVKDPNWCTNVECIVFKIYTHINTHIHTHTDIYIYIYTLFEDVKM